MKINFFDKKCQSQTHRHKFGICDQPFPPETPAYLDTENPRDWIAIVENSQEIEATFTAIDNCIEIRRPNGEMDSRCDGMLTYDKCIIFVELNVSCDHVWIVVVKKIITTVIGCIVIIV